MSTAVQGYRLSPQQKRLWLLQQQDQSAAYCAQCAIIIQGELRPEILVEAIRQVIDRHEILRTDFYRRTGMKVPVQVIAESNRLVWRELDRSNLDEATRRQSVEELFDEERRAIVASTEEAVLHATLARLSAEEHLLLLSLPALCADAATMQKLAEEVSRAYAACESNRELPDEAVQYADISEVLNELLEAEDRDAELGRAYWRKQNIHSFNALALPFENRRGEQSFRPDSLTLNLERVVGAEIKALADKLQTTTELFLLTCWQTLLWRLTGQPDVVVGRMFDGRKYEDLQEALGLFARWLPVSCHFEGSERFGEILSRIDETTRQTYEWQEYFSWEQASDSSGNDGALPFFPAAFDYDEAPAELSSGATPSFRIDRLYACLERFKLKLSGAWQGDALITEFHFDANLFRAEHVRRIAEYFHRLVESVVNNPEIAISQLEVLGDEERHRLLVEFNQTQTERLSEDCLHTLFEQQAARKPDKPAVIFEERQLSYGELNARSNQVARRLQRMGVGPEVRVAICMERSIEIVVGLLGILKAGGAYVPLDPVLPPDRLAFMLEDAEAKVLLTQRHLVENLGTHAPAVLLMDQDWDAIAAESEENPKGSATADNLAYVIYTSGSTGRPKGVAVEHRQLINYLSSILKRLDLPPDASFATVSTFAADLGNTVVFSSLCAGGSLHVISKERASNSEALADYFRQHRIDCLKIVPSHLAALLASSQSENILPRQRLILGGEASNWDLIEKLERLAPDCLILNHYGPTETTIGVLTYQVEKQRSGHASATVPLGRPINNTQIYLLDAYLKPVPIGLPGELFIGGECLTRGYLKNPEANAEKFIPNPFDNQPGGRLYRTGDLARFLPDGNVEFLGRTDRQVKIRGYRIEVGEVEAVLNEHPAVREALVVAREETTGDKRLVAYVVAARGQAPASRDLRGFLHEKLPEYMMPSAFVIMDALPLTPNGKIDLQSLPDPEKHSQEMQAAYVAPRSEVEQLIAATWQDILRVEQVGLYDNFFDLGGHSLFMIQVHSKLLEIFDKDISMIDLFKYTTVDSLAKFLSEEKNISPSFRRSRERAEVRRESMKRQRQLRQAH